MSNEIQQCIGCGNQASGNYCSGCGQPVATSRLTVKSMLDELFHFFTHFDKGFPYTLKKLMTAPGYMQREYIAGTRKTYQKPFSMFFICATFAALALYWINLTLVNYFDAGDSKEAAFFHQYWALLQVVMLPVYALITYLFFRNEKLNYAEVVVLHLYLFSFLFLMLTLIHLLKFIWPELQTRYIELPAILIYTIVTNLKFFAVTSKPGILIKTVCAIALSFFLANTVQDMLVSYFS